MKLRYKALAALCIVGTFAFAGCDNGDKPTPVENEKVIAVTAAVESIDIKDYEVSGYDYTPLFSITEDGEAVAVLSSYIDSSAVTQSPGAYTVTCTYETKAADLTVNVIETVYEVALAAEEVTVPVSQWNSYDYLALFTATTDSVAVEITEDMISSDVSGEPGDYSYTVTWQGASKTLIVHISDEHEIDAVAAYREIEVEESALSGFDFASLFYLYVDGVVKQVTESMIDLSALAGATAGDSAEVKFSYTEGSSRQEASVVVKVVEDSVVTVAAKNVVTYPNSAPIDLTSLFEIKKGEEVIPVTIDMLEGTVDYTKAGVNNITLTYGGETYTAAVEIKVGVVLGYAASDVVQIRKGTDQLSYDFASDFRVIINGIAFTELLDAYLDTSEVDFSTAGSYPVTLTVKYNTGGFDIFGTVHFTEYSETITYVVIENTYTIRLGEESVVLPENTDNYDVYSNLTVFVNGIDVSFTERKDWAGVTAVYVQTLSDPIDYTEVGEQEVRIAVYVNGVSADPVIVTYSVRVQSALHISAQDAAVFSGENLQVKDLFTITEGETEIPVGYDMLTGKVDLFTPGIYTITLEYRGLTQQAQVTVFDGAMLGTYKTLLTTFNSSSNTGYDDDEEEVVAPTYPLQDLVISKDGISVNGVAATVTGALDEHTMLIKASSVDFTLYYENGIAVLIPDNSTKLLYTEYKRPLVYFHEDEWTLNERVVINSSSTYYVLEAGKILCYSLDTFSLTSKTTGESMWYGLYVRIAETTSADTVYMLAWGEVTYAENFTGEVDSASSLQFDGVEYAFVMLEEGRGKFNNSETDGRYANMTFTGTVDGKPAELYVTSAEGFRFSIDGVQQFSVSSYELNNMKNGGANYADNTVLLYSYSGDVYSYKFALDLENKTFTILERDRSFGLYQTSSMYFFLDGYGTGIANFNPSSYSVTQFVYTITGNEIAIRYINTTPSFAYGTSATFYLGDLLNTLTVKEFTGSLAETTFVNTIITDGAIVNVSTYQFAKSENTATGRNAIYSAVEIVTKDGTVADSDKSKYIDTSVIAFGTPGFYQMTITVEVGGESVKCVYAIQILGDIYQGEPIVQSYGGGVLYSSNSLLLDVYGRAYLTCGDVNFVGSYRIGEDGSFVIMASSASGKITAVGQQVADGIVRVICSGAASFIDYFTTGTVRSSGAEGAVLREFTVNGVTSYVYAYSTTSTGNFADVELVESTAEGDIYSVTVDGSTVYVKILAWGNLTEGLEVLKNYA